MINLADVLVCGPESWFEPYYMGPKLFATTSIAPWRLRKWILWSCCAECVEEIILSIFLTLNRILQKETPASYIDNLIQSRKRNYHPSLLRCQNLKFIQLFWESCWKPAADFHIQSCQILCSLLNQNMLSGERRVIQTTHHQVINWLWRKLSDSTVLCLFSLCCSRSFYASFDAASPWTLWLSAHWNICFWDEWYKLWGVLVIGWIQIWSWNRKGMRVFWLKSSVFGQV